MHGSSHRATVESGTTAAGDVPGRDAELSGYEVLGLRVVADDGRGGLLGLVLPAGLLTDGDADPIGVEQVGHPGVVLEIGTCRVSPRVSSPPPLLAEQPL